MKMIEVFDLMAKKEIKHKTLLIVYSESVGYVYKYDKLYRTFLNDDSKRMEEDFMFGDDFLNFDVKLIPPKEKKYLVKFNMRGLDNECKYLNYSNSRKSVILNVKISNRAFQTRFTKSELQSIQLVREFLEDMEGKFELIEVEE
ncbi:hypothetical protein CIRMBP1230_00437 [Enterococcus cecorum]|nr:hypothetical protein CIRMBP1230_00437 [Enterococcus cecorum]